MNVIAVHAEMEVHVSMERMHLFVSVVLDGRGPRAHKVRDVSYEKG